MSQQLQCEHYQPIPGSAIREITEAATPPVSPSRHNANMARYHSVSLADIERLERYDFRSWAKLFAEYMARPPGATHAPVKRRRDITGEMFHRNRKSPALRWLSAAALLLVAYAAACVVIGNR